MHANMFGFNVNEFTQNTITIFMNVNTIKIYT